MKCNLCGCEFDESRRTPCESCPVKSGCEFICCPQCGYKTIESSPLTRKLGRVIKSILGDADAKS